MSWKYALRRIGIFFLTIFLAATLNFFIPRLSPQDPVAALLGRMASVGHMVEGGDELIAMYRQRFGLDQPLYVQYLNYMGSLLHGDLGHSLSYFPTKAETIIYRALPWTAGLFAVSILIAFVVGNLMGALAAWPNSPKLFRGLVYLLMPCSAIPYYLLALLLIFVFAIILPIFPLGHPFTVGSARGWNLDTFGDLLYHSVLPVASLVIGVTGFWALLMRGVMKTQAGEDYMLYARAKGLKDKRIFTQYAVRNALLPQVTGLALDLGRMMAGFVLVEIIFNFPGVGWVMYNGILNADYFVVQGCVLVVIVSVAFATLVVDLIYPLIDPRIRYE